MAQPFMDRAFVRIAEGLVHLRRMDGAGQGRPLVLIHPSPGSSYGLIGLMGALNAARPGRTLIAPDTLGGGDSAPPQPDEPDIAYYADALMRLLDALRIDRVDLYGGHTGARIACEAAILYPDRVGCVVMDGITEYEPALREELLARYAPAMKPDDYGTQFSWAFNFVRDMSLHFPYYARDPQHRLTGRPVPSAEALHGQALEVLKALTTYHKAYNAVFRYPAKARIGLVGRPAMLLRTSSEIPGLNTAASEMAQRLAGAREVEVGADLACKAEAIATFLDSCEG